MVFTRFVEIGRVCLINYGPDVGKLCTIIEVIDSKRVLIDGPQSITGVHRQVINCRRLSLTDIVIAKLPRNAKVNNIVKAWKEQNVVEKWGNTAWAKKLESKKRRAVMSDFDRFKLMVAKKQKSKIIADKIAELEA